MEKGLNFYWRMDDYALEACQKHLTRLDPDETNVTIELVKFFQHQGNMRQRNIV